MIDPKAIASTRAEIAQFLSEQADRAAIGFLHAAEQAQQGGFAAAAGPLEEQGFTRLQAERRDIQQHGLPRPTETQVIEFDKCLGHGEEKSPV